MQNRENHHAANGLRLGVLLPVLLVLMFGLLALQNVFNRPAEIPQDKKTQTVRPGRNPFPEVETAASEEPEETYDLRSGPILSKVPKTERVAAVRPLPIEPPAAIVTPPPVVAEAPPTQTPPNSARIRTARNDNTELKPAAITGRITLRGTPPPNPVINLRDNPDCGKMHKENPIQPFFVVREDGSLADVVVSLKGDSLRRSKGRGSVSIDQKDCMYVPYVSAVQAGQKIFVKNSDLFLHNVHPTPNVPRNKERNVAQFPNKVDEFVFDAPEKFLRFKCDVHPWMFAYVSVFDHPYFAVTGADGRFVLQDLLPGQYIVEATHRKAGTITQEVRIKSRSDIVELNLEFNLDGGRGFTQAKANP